LPFIFVIVALLFYFCIVYPLLKFWMNETLARADRIAYGGSGLPRRINDRGRGLPDRIESIQPVQPIQLMEKTVQAQPLKNIDITVVLPKSFDENVALARVDLLDNSPDAKPFTVLRTEQIVLCKTTGSFSVPFSDLPSAGAYAAYVHVLVRRENYDTKDCFIDIRPGDCMTPLPIALTSEEGSITDKQEVALIQLIEHAPFVGQNC
jgi:hypothetical protein